MSLKVGIVGLPNVGKSTLFNALTRQHAPAANFPFTTVDPNVGVVTVPDERLDRLAALSRSARTVPKTIEFVDIAGLVKGAHAGEGLGNQFLAHIREADAIAEVVRCFPVSEVVHVAGNVDPARDVETIHTELALADLVTLEKIIERERRDLKSGDSLSLRRAETLGKLRTALAEESPARSVTLTPPEAETIRDLQLLTAKPLLIVANLDEAQIRHPATFITALSAPNRPVVPLSVKIEQELTEVSPTERAAFLSEYGLAHSGLDDLVRAAYVLLDLITFFTTGPKETRAWTIARGATAPKAAGKVHSDFERGFIRAETIFWEVLIAAGSYVAAREQGLVRDEGKEYVVQDGDVFIFTTSL